MFLKLYNIGCWIIIHRLCERQQFTNLETGIKEQTSHNYSGVYWEEVGLA